MAFIQLGPQNIWMRYDHLHILIIMSGAAVCCPLPRDDAGFNFMGGAHNPEVNAAHGS